MKKFFPDSGIILCQNLAEEYFFSFVTKNGTHKDGNNWSNHDHQTATKNETIRIQQTIDFAKFFFIKIQCWLTDLFF